jgi:cytochrome c biogenesis protein CcdA/thiol-disulfide isomerase/thioredoxin
MLGFIAISFIAGMLTVLAPCILPLLPVIIGGSVSGESSFRRAVIIVASLGVSVFVFTLVLKVSTAFITIPQFYWQLLSGGLLFFFGIVTFAPHLWDLVPGTTRLYRSSNKLLGSGYLRQNIGGDVLMGAALGPVFSSCSPTYFVILAAVLPAHFATGIVYLLAYTLGLCLFLLLIALLGQRVALSLGVATDPKGWFKKAIGIVFMVVGVAIVLGFDKKIEAAFPAGAFGEIGIEQGFLNTQSTSTSTTSSSTPLTQTPHGTFLSSLEKSLRYQKAPELVSPDGYLNTNGQPISLKQFLGNKVVLVDFWDYSCINCQRTFPYLKAWYEKYKDQGLVIIGVHTPEFAFEQLQSNVDDAAKRFGLTYPIVLDNHYQTWNAFQNEYWPREYLIDIDGYIVHDHSGEGEYDQTETAIQQALAERASRLNTTTTIATSTIAVPAADLSGVQSPETYFGANRNEYLGNGSAGVQGMQHFVFPDSAKPNRLYLGGTWDISPEYAEAKAGSAAEFLYSAHDVYIVTTSVGGPARVKVLRDGKPVGALGGSDVDPKTSETVINGDRLYTLIHDPLPGIHTIEIQIESGTLDAYTFTFG